MDVGPPLPFDCQGHHTAYRMTSRLPKKRLKALGIAQTSWLMLLGLLHDSLTQADIPHVMHCVQLGSDTSSLIWTLSKELSMTFQSGLKSLFCVFLTNCVCFFDTVCLLPRPPTCTQSFVVPFVFFSPVPRNWLTVGTQLFRFCFCFYYLLAVWFKAR